MMDNPTSADLGEKITNNALPTFVPAIVEDDLHHFDSEPLRRSPVKGKRRGGPWLKFFRGYGAALVIGLPVLPVVVSAVTIVIYLSNSSISGWLAIVSGVGSTYIAWLLVSLLLIPLTSPRNGNSRSYGLLESRYQQLLTRLNVLGNEYPVGNDPKYQALPDYQKTALNEAYDKLDEITETIDDSHTRLAWALGYGYVNAWSMLHRAEEALVEVESKQMVMRGAMHDKMAISGSQMSNSDELLAKLRFAARKLDPSMIGLFKPLAVPAPPEENEESPDIQQLEKDVEQIAEHLGVKLRREHKASSTDDGSKPAHDGDDEARARVTLREVRRSLNDYRDHLWEGLLRARNNLLGVTFVTGLGTHILLCIAILALPSNASSHATIIAAVSYYMLGAIAGLFGRIGQATLSNIAVDDYGLTLAQVISRPLYSGLAGLGGVLLSSTVLGISTTNTVSNVFSPLRLDYLIVAAAFGLTPNLVSGSLQSQSNKLLSALRSSKTTVTDKNASNDEGQSAGN